MLPNVLCRAQLNDRNCFQTYFHKNMYTHIIIMILKRFFFNTVYVYLTAVKRYEIRNSLSK